MIAAGYASVMILGMIMGPKFARENADSRNGTFLPLGFSGKSEKVDRILEIINSKYVDPVKIDTIRESAIDEIIKHLDPHTSYLPPMDARLLTEDLEGNFNGIGIEYYILNDTVLVTAVNPGGPAAKAGLEHGDQILQINKVKVAGTKVNSRQVVENMRGRRGTVVNLLVKRGAEQMQVSVTRDKITVSSIETAYMLNNNTGYIKISRFGDQTDEDFLASLKKLQAAGMKNLVLDLRHNGGGYLNSAISLADQFLPEKKLIVYTQGLHEPRTNYLATAEGRFEQGKLAVLIDENTASASEIVAGAVQDLGRGVIVGRRSFGKGLVQEQFDFDDGSALNLTIARYYTPSGRSIQKPYDKGVEAYYKEIDQRFKTGELSSDGRKITDSLIRKNKTFRATSGKAVFGGGGILPDIYIPLDTTMYTGYYTDLAGKGVLNEFVFQHLVSRGTRFTNVSDLLRDFKLKEDDFAELKRLAAAKNIKSAMSDSPQSRKAIEADVKALLARYYLGDEGFYKVLNAEDQAIARSLDALK